MKKSKTKNPPVMFLSRRKPHVDKEYFKACIEALIVNIKDLDEKIDELTLSVKYSGYNSEIQRAIQDNFNNSISRRNEERTQMCFSGKTTDEVHAKIMAFQINNERKDVGLESIKLIQQPWWMFWKDE